MYLRSPSGCRDSSGDSDPSCSEYLPYRNNYDDWAVAIAQPSKHYPVVRAWAMDEFANSNNLEYLTPAYLSHVRQVSRAIQPTLEFYPVVYHQYITQSFVSDYAPVMDALIMRFRDGLYRNTAWTGTLRNHVDSAAAVLASRSRKLILMV